VFWSADDEAMATVRASPGEGNAHKLDSSD